MISKERVTVGQIMGGRPLSIGNDLAAGCVPQREGLLEMVACLTGMFLVAIRCPDTPENIPGGELYCLGQIVTGAEADGRAPIIQGQQLFLSLALLLIYLHRRLTGRPNRRNLEDLIIYDHYGERILNPDVDELRPVLEALLHGSESTLGELSESASHLVERYRVIQDCFPAAIDGDVLSFFADWLVRNVTLDQTVAHSKEGSRILQNALAFENMVCTSRSNHSSM